VLQGGREWDLAGIGAGQGWGAQVGGEGSAGVAVPTPLRFRSHVGSGAVAWLLLSATRGAWAAWRWGGGAAGVERMYSEREYSSYKRTRLALRIGHKSLKLVTGHRLQQTRESQRAARQHQRRRGPFSTPIAIAPITTAPGVRITAAAALLYTYTAAFYLICIPRSSRYACPSRRYEKLQSWCVVRTQCSVRVKNDKHIR
jgi:hypothetical protein